LSDQSALVPAGRRPCFRKVADNDAHVIDHRTFIRLRRESDRSMSWSETVCGRRVDSRGSGSRPSPRQELVKSRWMVILHAGEDVDEVVERVYSARLARGDERIEPGEALAGGDVAVAFAAERSAAARARTRCCRGARVPRRGSRARRFDR
jgi:hypothetical protein